MTRALAVLLSLSLACPAGAVARAALPVAPVRAVLPVSPLPTLSLLRPGVFAAPSLAPTPAPSLAALSAAPAPAPAALAAPAEAPLPPAPPARSDAGPTYGFFSFNRTVAMVPVAAPDAAPETRRADSDQAWDGAAESIRADEPVAAKPAPSAPRRLHRPTPRSIPGLAGFAAPLAVVSAPLALALPHAAWITAVLPYVQGGAYLAGAYATMRLAHWAIAKFGPRLGLDKNGMALARLVSGVGIWAAAAGYGLHMIGVADNALLTTFGGSGAAMALAVKEVVGNLVHGVHFLVTKPFTVGDKVVIDEVPGVVHELTLRYVIVKTDLDPAYAYYTYAELTGKAVTVSGVYETRRAGLNLRRPALPHGLWKALKDAASPKLWRPAIYSALGIAALSFLPLARGFFVGQGVLGWFDALLPYANAGLTVFLARSLAQSIHGAIERLGARYGWNKTVVTLLKLGASALVWGVGGSFALNALGVSWAALGTTLTISTVIVGIAVNDYVSDILQAALVLALRPFEIGDAYAKDKIKGEVLDINFQHVVVRKDASSYYLLPYAVVKGFRSPRDPANKAK